MSASGLNLTVYMTLKFALYFYTFSAVHNYNIKIYQQKYKLYFIAPQLSAFIYLLFYRYTLSQIPWHIHIQSFLHCHMVCQHLHRYDT